MAAPGLPDIGRLCHYVALNKMGATEEVIGQLVEATIIESTGNIVTEAALQQEVNRRYRLNIPLAALRSSIGRLLDAGRLRRIAADVLEVALDRRREFQDRMKAWQDLEASVKSEYRERLADMLGGAIQDSDFGAFWEVLSKFLGKSYCRHGIRTAELIAPGRDWDSNKALLTGPILDPNDPIVKHFGEDLVKAAISAFFQGESENRSRYLAGNLSSTFSYFALAVDEETARYLASSIDRLLIVVDTNFLFGILGLHENPLNEVCREIVSLVTRHNLPIKFYFHEETLTELGNWIHAQASTISGQTFPAAVSLAAAEARDLPMLARQYHEENARSPIDVDAFLMRFQGLEAALREKGFQRLTAGASERLPDAVRWEETESYREFLISRPLWKPRTDSAVEHDVIVVHSVLKRMRANASPLRVGAYMLTVDTHLHAYCLANKRGPGGRAPTILPSQLMQLLYPLLPTSEAWEEGLAVAFEIPAFRSIGVDRGEAQGRILKVLRGVEGISTEQAVECLTNELLVTKVAAAPDDAAVVEAIESSIVFENQKLKERLAEEQKTTADLALQAADDGARIDELAKELLQARGELLEIRNQQQEEMELARRKSERARAVKKWALTSVALGVSVIAVWFWPLPEWNWFASQSKEGNIRVFLTIAIVLGAVAVVGPRSWRTKLMYVLFVDVVLGVLSSLDELPF